MKNSKVTNSQKGKQPAPPKPTSYRERLSQNDYDSLK